MAASRVMLVDDEEDVRQAIDRRCIRLGGDRLSGGGFCGERAGAGAGGASAPGCGHDKHDCRSKAMAEPPSSGVYPVLCFHVFRFWIFT